MTLNGVRVTLLVGTVGAVALGDTVGDRGVGTVDGDGVNGNVGNAVGGTVNPNVGGTVTVGVDTTVGAAVTGDNVGVDEAGDCVNVDGGKLGGAEGTVENRGVGDNVGRFVRSPLGINDAWMTGCSDRDPVTVGLWVLLDGMTVRVTGKVACAVGTTDDELEGDREGLLVAPSAGVGRSEPGTADPVDRGDNESGRCDDGMALVRVGAETPGLGCTDTVGDNVDGTKVVVSPVGDPDDTGFKGWEGGNEAAVAKEGVTEGTPVGLCVDNCGV